MRTNFSPAQLCDNGLADAEKNLRKCVHCGICTATCPTYVLLGDERDSPRGRIVLMQNMLEAGGAPTPETVLHIDRCLSCLACRTACPSSVDYARLVDTARAHIEAHYRRPLGDRLMRFAIARVMTNGALVKSGVALARVIAPLARLLSGRLGAMARIGAKSRAPRRKAAQPEVAADARRVALMPGCVQGALAPQIDEAVARVLARRGYRLQTLAGAGCCGALVHHLGRTQEAKNWARRAIESFERAGPFDAVLISATGCSAHLKDYAHLLAEDPVFASRAAAFVAKVKDFSEIAAPAPAATPRPLRVAYHAACSAQNSLKLSGQSEALLEAAGFEVLAIPEGHLCCGSAGSYSILQPKIASELRVRKLVNIAGLAPDVIASGNIGCLSHLAGEDAPPALHLAELIDWAEDGPRPVALDAPTR